MSVFPKPEPPVIEMTTRSASNLRGSEAARVKPIAPCAAKPRKKTRTRANRAT